MHLSKLLTLSYLVIIKNWLFGYFHHRSFSAHYQFWYLSMSSFFVISPPIFVLLVLLRNFVVSFCCVTSEAIAMGSEIATRWVAVMGRRPGHCRCREVSSQDYLACCTRVCRRDRSHRSRQVNATPLTVVVGKSCWLSAAPSLHCCQRWCHHWSIVALGHALQVPSNGTFVSASGPQIMRIHCAFCYPSMKNLGFSGLLNFISFSKTKSFCGISKI